MANQENGNLMNPQANTLEQLATMFLMQNPQQQGNPNQPPTVNIGGRNILDATPRRFGDRLGSSLNQLATNYLQMQQMKRKGEFMKSIQNIMGSTALNEDKVNQLRALGVNYPDLWKALDIEDNLKGFATERKTSTNVIPSFLNEGEPVPEGFKVTGYDQKGRRMIREKPQSIASKTQEKDIAALNIKRQVLNKDLESFFAVDDVLQQARGTGAGRFGAGTSMTAQAISQNTPLGRAVATHNAAVKRLRVQLVRAAGDVGNINVVEQEAAEKLIPTRFDDAQTAELKRAYLIQVAQAINNNDGNAVKETINNFMRDAGIGNKQQPNGLNIFKSKYGLK